MKIIKRPMIIFIRRQLLIGALVFLAGTSLFGLNHAYEDNKWEQAMNEPGLSGKTVIIDPGHGGADPGAISGGVQEADINWALADSLKKLLENRGVNVKLTRHEDEGLVAAEVMTYDEQWEILEDRKKFAENEHGHFLLSIHSNSHKDVTASGAIVFYADEKYKELAQKIQDKLVTLGPKQRPIEMRNFAIINGSQIPSVLIEVGFITNQRDRELLTQQKDLIAAKILEGLDEYAQNLRPSE